MSIAMGDMSSKVPVMNSGRKYTYPRSRDEGSLNGLSLPQRVKEGTPPIPKRSTSDLSTTESNGMRNVVVKCTNGGEDLVQNILFKMKIALVILAVAVVILFAFNIFFMTEIFSSEKGQDRESSQNILVQWTTRAPVVRTTSAAVKRIVEPKMPVNVIAHLLLDITLQDERVKRNKRSGRRPSHSDKNCENGRELPQRWNQSTIHSGIRFNSATRRLIINETASYFVYSQVVFENSIKTTSQDDPFANVRIHTLCRHRNGVLNELSRSMNSPTKSTYDQDTNIHTSYLGQVIHLRQDDQLIVRVSGHNLLEQRLSFLGLFKVADRY